MKWVSLLISWKFIFTFFALFFASICKDSSRLQNVQLKQTQEADYRVDINFP